MARLIDADDLIKTIPNTNIDMFENCGRCTLLDKEEVIAIINKAPTIDAEHVRQGKWVLQYRNEDICGREMYCVRQCSLCEAYYRDVGYGWNYCPNCGAKMDEGEEE